MSSQRTPILATKAEGMTTPVKDYKSTSTLKAAFREGDVEMSRQEHLKPINHDEPHGSDASDYVKSIIFGGLDGIMTVFAIIAAAAGSNTSYTTILIFGFSNVVADGFAMGFGEFVSGSAELDHANIERKREEWEVANSKDLEIEEMIEVYKAKGLSEDDAKTFVGIISKDDKVFVDFMMNDELGIVGDLDDTMEPLKQGCVMLISFVLFGSIPLMAYLFSMSGQGMDGVFAASCLLTTAALLCLGAIKGHLTGMNIPRAAMLMLLNGCVSGGVSFGVSFLVEGFVHSQPLI